MTPPETCAMPGGHDGQQLRFRQPRQVGPDRQRRLGLAQEQRRGHVQRLGPAGPHQPGHDHGKHADDPLHHAQVVEHGEQGRDEDHRRQDAKREHEPGRPLGGRPGLCRRRTPRPSGAVEHRLDRRHRPAAAVARRPAPAAPAARTPIARPAPRRRPAARWPGGCSDRKTATPRIAIIPSSPRARSARSSRSMDSGSEKSPDHGPIEIRYSRRSS